MREVLPTKHYSYRTEQAYPDWIERYILFHHKRHPRYGRLQAEGLVLETL